MSKNGAKWQKNICHTPYLRKHISWLSFMVHICKMIISPGSFLIIWKFWFFSLSGGKRAKKCSKMTNIVCHAPYLNNHTSYDLWYKCKMITSPGIFFIFSKFWFSGLLGGKRAKTVQNGKKFCLSHSISQEWYIIWLSFMVHKCKMIMSPGIFFIFAKSSFSGLLAGKRAKTVQNGKIFCLSHSISQEWYIIWLSFMVHKCKMIMSPGIFFIFSKFWFSGLLGGKRAKMVQNGKKLSLWCSISQKPYIIWLSFMVHICKMIISPGAFLNFLKFLGLLVG